MSEAFETDTGDEALLMSRRVLMAGGLMLGAAASMPAMGAAAATSGREEGIPTDPAARIAMIRRMRMRADAGPVFWWFRGRNYAQQGAKLIPMCDMIFGALMDIRPTADGGLMTTQYELAFRCALDSGVRAEKLLNPITGTMVDVPFAPVGPTKVVYNAENVLQLPPTIGGSKFTVEHVPELFFRIGDTVCFQTHSRARAETQGQSDRVLNDMSMICSPAAEALDPKRAFASATAYGTDVTDYARWWKMPPGLGTQTLRSAGMKVARYQDMPQDWRDMVAKADPAMAADPMGVLSRAAATYRN
ncbi:hypothetical protein [Novosphingobium sp. KACC 22771]|uniref:hypothetical protein n=1 Tax=Novosphingobium sp. KACC 22771 TaxID=3025670 RepID=UPI0023665850|nr:hypothetical protein [Novosphingobium sp. KACC 22771]WDF74873.1 hypothetical protein PQ467_17770 [Novosphingobium sp. KACC 22771]